MKGVVDFFKAVGLVTAAIGAMVIGPILGIIVVVCIAIGVAYLMIRDHHDDMKDIKSD